MTKYNSSEALRYKRYIINDDEEFSSSFCGLSDDKKRQTMQEEAERLVKDQYDNFQYGSSSKKSKRQTINNAERERTCCHIYIRIDPTLWDIVYNNEGLNVRKIFLVFSYLFLMNVINLT